VRYGEETIERIREAAGLVELIGSTVALRKVGQTWKGLCPFHQEKTPSFTVNPDRQAYHCFGCGAGGDCFRFVMETEKLSFVEAVQALADRFGVPLPKPAEEEQHGRAYQALEEAATFYRRVLEDPEAGRAARDYLAARGLSPATLEAFGVGLAPAGWDQLLSRLGPRLGTGALIEAGLVVARERGEGHYDRFRSRIVVPLRLPSGRVVGFGGRALGDEEPKYLNSPETAVYRKGRFLFGLDRARAAIREQGRAVLVEGYFDVLGLAQAGVTEAIATCGTALTGEQCRIVQRTAPAILLVFDGDTAGQAAAEKALVPCVQAGLAARVVTLPAGEDPDTLVRGTGREAFDRLVAEARSPSWPRDTPATARPRCAPARAWPPRRRTRSSRACSSRRRRRCCRSTGAPWRARSRGSGGVDRDRGRRLLRRRRSPNGGRRSRRPRARRRWRATSRRAS
jgi:DNA primase